MPPRPVPGAVEVKGLRDLQRELRKLDKSWPKELRLANKSVAEIVAEGTRKAFLSRPGVAPKAALTVRSMAQQRNASVKIGGNLKGKSERAKGAQTAMGSNFGTKGKYPQFPPIRKPDYALYATIQAKRSEVVDSYGKAVERLTKQAFPR